MSGDWLRLTLDFSFGLGHAEQYAITFFGGGGVEGCGESDKLSTKYEPDNCLGPIF